MEDEDERFLEGSGPSYIRQAYSSLEVPSDFVKFPHMVVQA